MGAAATSLHGLSVEQVLQMIGEYFSDRRMSVRDAFLFLDVDGSNFVTWDEFYRGVQLCTEGIGGYGLQPAALLEVFRRFDTNGDNKLSIEEFAAAFSPTSGFGGAHYSGSYNSIGVQQVRSVNPPAVVPADVLQRRLAEDVITRVASAIVRSGHAPQDVFNKLDTDRNGWLSWQELEHLILSFQPDLAFSEKQAVFDRFDRDRSGHVDLNEFCRALQEANATALVSVEDKVKYIGDKFKARGLTIYDSFAVFDRNGDGYLTREEWQRAMSVLAPDLHANDVEAVFRRFDVDYDGYMNIAEFQRFFQNALDRHSVVQTTPGVWPVYQAPPAEEPWQTQVLDLVKSCLSTSRTQLTASEVFRRLDIDNNQTLSSFEFNRVVTTYQPNLTQQQLEALFYKVNISGSGSISLGEFVRRFG
mmetsp:Transcript_68667/g.154309  ORF Transcript_68667/g.154309 Transcript_68667/m.154309 type:complete len:417 (-) Transcript_68667:85-1335(-)